MNPSSAATSVSLLCHPATPCTTPLRIDVSIHWTAEGLVLSYALKADLTTLRIPARTPARRTDGLWQHTCLEAFVRAAGGTQYFELNFSPSSEWAVYRFSGYREGMEAVQVATPSVAISRDDQGLQVGAVVGLPDLELSDELQMGIAAVIEEREGKLSYWALAHPGSKPDFHDERGFVLRVRRG